MREGKGAAGVRTDDLEATIRSATASKAEIVQKHRDGNQLGIRIERTRCASFAPKSHERPTWLKSQGDDSAFACA